MCCNKWTRDSLLLLQAVTDRIRRFNNRTFPCVSVDISIMLINYQTFANIVEILVHMKSKTLHLFYAIKIQNCSKSRKKSFMYLWMVLSSCKNGSSMTVSFLSELQFSLLYRLKRGKREKLFQLFKVYFFIKLRFMRQIWCIMNKTWIKFTQ